MIMKKLILTITAIAFGLTVSQAQINREVDKTTTTLKVTEKGTEVKTKVVESSETKSNVLQVEGNLKQDQATKVITNTSSDMQVVKDDVSVDGANNQLRIDNMKRQQMELENSKQAEMKKAEMKKQQLEAEALQRQTEMEVRRAALETRPKGMVKLKKD